MEKAMFSLESFNFSKVMLDLESSPKTITIGQLELMQSQENTC